LIATVSLEGEIVEHQVPDGFETLLRRDPAPELAIEAAVVVVEANESAGAGAAPLSRLHAGSL